jgi:hypothetical protein
MEEPVALEKAYAAHLGGDGVTLIEAAAAARSRKVPMAECGGLACARRPCTPPNGRAGTRPGPFPRGPAESGQGRGGSRDHIVAPRSER